MIRGVTDLTDHINTLGLNYSFWERTEKNFVACICGSEREQHIITQLGFFFLEKIVRQDAASDMAHRKNN